MKLEARVSLDKGNTINYLREVQKVCDCQKLWEAKRARERSGNFLAFSLSEHRAQTKRGTNGIQLPAKTITLQRVKHTAKQKGKIVKQNGHGLGDRRCLPAWLWLPMVSEATSPWSQHDGLFVFYDGSATCRVDLRFPRAKVRK